MRGLRSGRVMRRAAAVALALGVVSTSTTSATASPTPPSTPAAQGTTAGAAWQVTAAGAAGYLVRLTLPGAVPVRAALPQLAVDGTVVGTARQDRDGRTLTVRTADQRVVRATRVDLAWNGVVVGTAHAPKQEPTPEATPASTGPVLPEDPAAARTYRVERADYDLGDTAVRLPGLGGQAVEFRAAVYLPVGAPGRRPVVVFLHGRHEPCYGDASGAAAVLPPAWPCPAGERPVPSHLGYGQAADALAAAGYAVVSISADGVNALDYAATDGGAQARGELVLAHLDQLKAWNTGRGAGAEVARLQGRLDLGDVGLMGHSRGGEGVVKAALLNAERPTPYGIRAVMPLAPVDFGRSTLPGVPMAVVLPYCDGDVSDQQGQHFYDDSRYAAGDDVQRTSLLVMGANHNYFNSEWTPGISAAPSFDDWYEQDDPVCGEQAPSRLQPAEQRAVGTAYVAGFFRLHLGGETQFLPLFDGSGGRAASAGRAVVHVEAQQPTSARTDLAPLQSASATVRTTAGAVYCASYGDAVPGREPPCASPPRTANALPHWTPAYLAAQVPASPMVRMTWNATAPAQAVTIGASGVVGVQQALTFRAATATRSRADLRVTLTDARGRRASTLVSQVSPALTPLPALTGFGPRPEPKTWLRTVRMPLAGFAGVDLGRLATVTIAASGSAGDVYLSDVALDAPAPGAGGPPALPSVSIGDAYAFVDARPARAQQAVTLSRPSTLPITVQVETDASSGGGRVASRWIPVTIPAGATTSVITFAVKGGAGDGSGQEIYENSLSVPTNAIVGDALGTLTVYPPGAGSAGAGSAEAGSAGATAAGATPAGNPGVEPVTAR